MASLYLTAGVRTAAVWRSETVNSRCDVSVFRFIRLLLTLIAAARPRRCSAKRAGRQRADPRPFPRRPAPGRAPSMGDPRFRRPSSSCRHSATRDGLIVNRPAGEEPLANLLKAFATTAAVHRQRAVYAGGPCRRNWLRAAQHDYRRTGNDRCHSRVAMTASKDIVRDVAAKTGPKKFLLVFGYAGWGRDSLRASLRNHWYTRRSIWRWCSHAARQVWDSRSSAAPASLSAPSSSVSAIARLYTSASLVFSTKSSASQKSLRPDPADGARRSDRWRTRSAAPRRADRCPSSSA